MNKKIIIWGYPLHSHTHSYIHNAIFDALNYLQYQVYWFDDNNYPKDFNWNDCVFITEGYADKHIPLNDSSIYFVHVCHKPEKYLGKVKKLIDIRYYVDFINDCNYNYKLDKNNCIELDLGVLQEKNTKDYEIVYMAWGTNLTPDKINLDDAGLKRKNIYYFIGTIGENKKDLQVFSMNCYKNGIEFIHIDPWKQPVSEEDNIRLTKESFLSPDFRGRTHKNWGYIACRLMKSISYGQLGITNSLSNKNFIDQSIIYSENIDELFDMSIKNMYNIDLIKYQMNIVKQKHTWVNRIQGLLKII